MVVLDLGCGAKKKPGSLGVDIARVQGVDLLADVTRTLPFRDESVDAVHCSHIVEHLDDLMSFMGEIWRVCRPGAVVYLRFPHGSNAYVTWKDPTHRRAVFLDTFDYFDPGTFAGRVFGYYHPAKFSLIRQHLTFNMNADTFVPRRPRRVVGRIFDALANRSERAQMFCERVWGPWVGMEEAHIWLRRL